MVIRIRGRGHVETQYRTSEHVPFTARNGVPNAWSLEPHRALASSRLPAEACGLMGYEAFF